MRIENGTVCFDNLVDVHSGKQITMECSDPEALVKNAESMRAAGQRCMEMFKEAFSADTDMLECFENVDAQLLVAHRNKQ